MVGCLMFCWLCFLTQDLHLSELHALHRFHGLGEPSASWPAQLSGTAGVN